MQTARIAIVGGGLRGLYAAFLLEQKGIGDYVLHEARDALGGRIVSVSPSEHGASETASTVDAINRFDLGPSWFWPASSPNWTGLFATWAWSASSSSRPATR